MSQFPDYYKLLNVEQSATQNEIRAAYKRESLRTHPDRVANATPAEKKEATEKFQAMADAYYVLSDPTRRREYDALYASKSSKSADAGASADFFSTFSNFFNGAGAGAQQQPPRPDAEGTFTDVFEELLRPEVEKHVPFWTYAGAVSGGGLGFIVANLPGMFLGGFAGSKLGAIRDAKGKSVAAVFNDLGGGQKAEILRALAMKVLGSAL